MTDYKKVAELMANYFLCGQDAQCLLCDNSMKNITIKENGQQGCDGNCIHNLIYKEEDLINLFIREIRISD